MPRLPPTDPGADTIRATQATRPSAQVDVELPPDLAIPPSHRYRPLRALGAGGMGEVTLVVDEVIGREVALKRLKSAAADDRASREAFAREAILQARLEHPSIVPVYDVTQDPDGTLFFTMRRVDGRSLADANLSYSRLRLLTAFNQICHAAHFAHEKGIIHRDIKPANIMLGRYGEVYLLDWGIARLAGRSDSSAGTIAYMSPEQAAGRGDLDARSDVYALGAILFEILTKLPLHARAPIDEMLASIESGADARPSVRAPDSDVPPELEAICVKATARDREQRYATARQLADAIERYLEGDRDLAMRARVSREHAERAAMLARDDTAAGRSAALGEVGRALAFDPTNAAALGTMVELLTTPPREVPAEAVQEMRSSERELDRARSRSGAVAITMWAVAAMVGPLLAGVVNVAEFILGTASAILAAGLSWVRLRRPRPDGFIPIYLVVGIAAALVGTGIGLSPVFVTPSLGILFILASTLSIDVERWLVPLWAGLIAITLPFVLEWLGVLPPSLVPRDNMLCMVPRMTNMPDTSNIAPWFSSAMFVVMGCFYMQRFRRALTALQRRNSVNNWQLRQLVPKL